MDLEGNKEVLALQACAEESKEGWLNLLQDVRTRGATQVDLIVTDGHDGLLGAVAELFSATPRQRWKVAYTTHCARLSSLDESAAMSKPNSLASGSNRQNRRR